MTRKPCKFIWYDVMTTDTKAAAKFYRDVIGWEAKDSGMPGGAYTIFSTGKDRIGGLMPIPEDTRAMGAKPCWMGYIAVPDVDDYAKRVKAAGGSIERPPTDIPGVGRFAVVGDPHGAGFMLFKGDGEAPTEAATGTPGHIGWHELHAGDGKAAWQFYSGLFDWTKTDALDMGPMGVYQLFATGGEAVGGMMTKMPDTPQPHWLYYFNVDAIDAAAARATRGGGKVIMGPHPVPTGQWIVQCTDPQGAEFAMVAMKR
jgi:uncharacterized protein